MTALITVTKVRPNTVIPYKDPNQPLNCQTWPGFIEIADTTDREDNLAHTITYRFQDRSYYENPTLTAEQLAVKAQGENWCTNNNIIVTIDVIDE
jgi:hypothetical protein